MSEEGGGKIKSKRQHGPNKPYERRKSFLGKVKDLITPSWLSSLVTTVKAPEENKYQKDDDTYVNPTVSSPQSRLVHQNDTRPPPVFVPLEKRNGTPNKTMAPPQSTNVSHAKPGQREVIPNFRQDPIPLQTGFTSSQLPLMPIHSHHHGENDDNLSDRSADSKSTSGCSSMIPHPPSTTQKDRVTLELNESDVSTMKDNLLESAEKTKSKFGLSLTWTAQYNTKRPKKPALQGKPSFDVSLFGSPISGASTSLVGDRLQESSFYPGRTTFGGAASQRRLSLNNITPYQPSLFPVRQKMKARPVNDSLHATTSGTAKKILETLEKMTTPLGDARKIPLDDTVMQSLSSSFSFTPSCYRRPTRHSIEAYMTSTRELKIPNKGPPLQKVSTPGSASLAANLQRFTTPEVQKNSSSTETTSSYQLPGSSQREAMLSSGNQGGKIKSKKFSQHLSSKKDEEEEQPYEMPQLKTDFTLPIKDMPTFNFNMPNSSPQPPVRPRTDTSNSQFTFSSPLNKLSVTPTDTPTGPPKMEFRFSSPIQEDKSATPKTKSVTFCLGDETVTSNLNHKTPILSNNIGASPVSQGFTRPQSGSSNNSPMTTGGFKVASELKVGSVMDILGKNSKLDTSSEASTKNEGLSKFVSKGWTCDACLVSNKEEADKCVACTTPKPGAKTGPPLTKNDSLSKFAAKGWTCDTCLVSNKDDADQCVACTTPKPGAKKSVTKIQSASGDSLQSLFKKPTGNWDCDVCLVPNKGEVTKCIACESPRPGTQPSSSGGFKIAPGAFSGQSGFIIGSSSNSNSNSGFSFGVDSKTTQQSGTGFKFGESIGSQSGTGFKFGESTVSHAGTGFKFGESTGSQAETGFKFGESAVKSGTEQSSSVTAGSGFKFGDASVKLDADSEKHNSGFTLNSVSDSKNTTATAGFVFGKSSSPTKPSEKTEVKVATGFQFGDRSTKSENVDKPLAGGFNFGKPTMSPAKKTEACDGKLNSDTIKPHVAVTSENVTKLSVTTSTVATTGLAFGFKSDSETKTTSTIPSFNLGQSVSSGQKTMSNTNGGFFFDQTSGSNKDISNDLKTGSVNSIFSNNISKNSNIMFGSDQKMSINSFSGTNNSGFAFNKKDEKVAESQPLFNSQSTKLSPNLKRGRDDGLDHNDAKKIFPSSETSSSNNLFQFGAKSTANTTVSSNPAGLFTFGQNKDNKPSGFSTTSFNFGGSSTTSSTVGFSTVPQATSTSVFNVTTPNISTGPVFGSVTTSAPVSTSAVFEFGSGTKTGNNSSMFGSNTSFGGTTSGVAFGSSNNPAPAFGSGTATGGFGSTAPAFGSSVNPSFGTSQTSSTPIFGAPQPSIVPAFGTPQTSTPAFGTSHTSSVPVFGASNTTSFGATAQPSSASGGFNFSAKPSFNFGQPTTNTVQPSANIFQFGGAKQAETPQQPAAPSGGFSFGLGQAATGPTFAFGATTPTPAAVPTFGGASSFGQPGTPQFTIGSSGSADNRKIKKAVRKIRR